MGTTVRRQPVSFKIPDSPDYQFLNITNFGGIEKSSNPFVVSSNTASDCLNVYVDEDNALSTRPRVQPKYDLTEAMGDVIVVGVYPIQEGYLMQVKLYEEDPVLLLRVNLEEKTRLTCRGATLSENKLHLFEQDGVIYILDGTAYLKLEGRDLSVVDGYIPTTRIGKTNISEGEAYESLNLIGSKFKETYFWDGSWNPDSIKKHPDDVVDNKYVENNNTRIIDSNGDFVRGEIFQTIKLLNDNDEGKKYFLAYLSDYYDKYNSNYVILAVDKYDNMLEDETIGIPFDINPTYSDDLKDRLICSDNGLSVVYIDNYEALGDSRGFYWMSRQSAVSEFLIDTEPAGFYGSGAGIFKIPSNGKYASIAPDGKLVALRTDTEDDRMSVFYRHDLSEAVNYISSNYTNIVDFSIGAFVPVLGYGCVIVENEVEGGVKPWYTNIQLTEDFSAFKSLSVGVAWVIELSDNEIVDAVGITIANDGLSFGYSFKTTINGNFNRSGIVVRHRTGPTTSDTTEDYIVAQSYMSDKYSGLTFSYSNDDAYLYFSGKNDLTGRILSRDGTLRGTSLGFNTKLTTASITSDTILNASMNTENVLEYSTSVFKFQSSEPLLSVVRNVAQADETSVAEHTKIKSKLSTANLISRFDNNTWFASGNNTFHTLYNDPTYIPLSSYNDLGEDYEEITGLCIVNDNILAAYKRNRIYIITPITVGDQLTYSYTETKNVIGNDAVGAPILTILTEMPTIVSYDGIYALNQLEHVQSSDRITTLVSSAINPLWLKESKSDIDGCQTLNRLYWTYYILPHEKIGDEKEDYTKVYLLDNRTQQWYYWELPLLILNSFVKDNKTHFVDHSGRVYTLETSDLLNEYNENVTEYYDNVDAIKRIIPWHWYSQILSLKTINYSKRLIDTTFILTDTDTQDEYALDYTFKAWRKTVSETNAQTISSNINYVQSTTKRTMIPRFNFIQIKLSNTEDDLDNNKLRLVGLGLKYVLLEGLY